MRLKETASRISRFLSSVGPCQSGRRFGRTGSPWTDRASSASTSPHAANMAATVADSSRSWVCIVASVDSSIFPARTRSVPHTRSRESTVPLRSDSLRSTDDVSRKHPQFAGPAHDPATLSRTLPHTTMHRIRTGSPRAGRTPPKRRSHLSERSDRHQHRRPSAVPANNGQRCRARASIEQGRMSRSRSARRNSASRCRPRASNPTRQGRHGTATSASSSTKGSPPKAPAGHRSKRPLDHPAVSVPPRPRTPSCISDAANHPLQCPLPLQASTPLSASLVTSARSR